MNLSVASVDIDQNNQIVLAADYFPFGSSRISETNGTYSNQYKFTLSPKSLLSLSQ